MTTGRGDSERGLSAAGMARKAAILAELDGAMRRRNRRRAAGRAAAVLVPAAALAAMVYWMGLPPKAASPRYLGPGIAQNDRPELWPRVEIVRTGTASLRMVRMIDDAELQSLLTETGKSSGLIRIGGRVIIESELEAPPSPTTQEPEPGING